MDINRTYSIIVLRGTRVRRFVVSQKGLRCLLWAALLLLGWGSWSVSDYVALQRQKVQEIRARAQAQRKKVSALGEQVKEVQELLARWKAFRENIQASLPHRFRATSEERHADEELQEVLDVLQGELKQMIASLPSTWPVRGTVVSGVGMRNSPWTGQKEFHPGLDIPKPVGTPVHAAGDGVVESLGKNGGKGLTVVLDHGQEITTQYAHLSKILVDKGDHVRKGQEIALVGNTGKSTGPHLHYEVRVNGVPIDPRQALLTAITPGK